MNAGAIPNLEGDKVEEIPPTIPNIPLKAQPIGLASSTSAPHSRRHTFQQSHVFIEKSPITQITKVILWRLTSSGNADRDVLICISTPFLTQHVFKP